LKDLGWEPPLEAILFDVDRTLVDVQSYTDYSAALAEVDEVVGKWGHADVPATSWDRPTLACMEALFSLSGSPRWQELSDLIEVYELAAVPQSVPMPGLTRAMASVQGLRTAAVTLLPSGATGQVLARHAIGVEVVVPR